MNAHAFKHLASEERKCSSTQTTEERVGGDGGRSKHEIGVDEVVECLKEDREEAESGKDSRDGRYCSLLVKFTRIGP